MIWFRDIQRNISEETLKLELSGTFELDLERIRDARAIMTHDELCHQLGQTILDFVDNPDSIGGGLVL